MSNIITICHSSPSFGQTENGVWNTCYTGLELNNQSCLQIVMYIMVLTMILCSYY